MSRLRSASDDSSVVGGSAASSARFCFACAIISISRRPTGSPRSCVSPSSMSTSGSGWSAASTNAGVYGLVCASESRYLVCTCASFVRDSGSSSGGCIGSVCSVGASSTSGATASRCGTTGREKNLWRDVPPTSAPDRTCSLKPAGAAVGAVYGVVNTGSYTLSNTRLSTTRVYDIFGGGGSGGGAPSTSSAQRCAVVPCPCALSESEKNRPHSS